MSLSSTSKDGLVSCLMLTGGAAGRQHWAKRALKSFLLQTYPRRELVIINQSLGLPHEYRVLGGPVVREAGGEQRIYETRPGVVCRELLVRRPASLGELRNRGLEEIRGVCWLPWDDDDWSHPKRLTQMMKQFDGKRAVAPTSHIRYSFLHDTAFRYHNPGGCGGISLYPAGPHRYAGMERGEDSNFFLSHYKDAAVWETWDTAHMYLRFFHGGNVGNEKLIMRKYAEAKWHGFWVATPGQSGIMTKKQAEYLAAVLTKEYGVLVPSRHLDRFDVVASQQRAREQEKQEEPPATSE